MFQKSFLFSKIISFLFVIIIFLGMNSGRVFAQWTASDYVRDNPTKCGFDAGITNASGPAADSNRLAAMNSTVTCQEIDTGELGFKIPSLGDLLTFAIRAFFVIAGLAALFYLLLGALGWVTSGGDKDAVTAAREKIQAAVIGMILIVAVLAIIWTLEQVIFNRKICLGLSCPLTLPGLIEESSDTFQLGTGETVMSTSDAFCCVCAKDDGTFGERINTHLMQCGDDGIGKPL